VPLDAKRTWTTQQTPSNGTLTDAANITWDCDVNGQSVKVTLGGNRTINAPTNVVEFTAYAIRVIQDATGNRTLAWNTAFKWPGGTAPVVTPTANSVSLFTFIGGAGGTLLSTGYALDIK
jgi:hypothetical protein